MKTRTFSRASFLLLIVCGLFAVAERSQAQSNSFWWHNILTQSGRNAAICQTAQSYADGTFTNVECKDWVRNVVKSASQDAINIPSSQNNWSWAPDSNVGVTGSWNSGNIVQLQINGGPHTMIILSTDSWGMYVIDCNWYCNSAPKRVYRHYLTWNDFYTKVSRFTIYYIK